MRSLKMTQLAVLIPMIAKMSFFLSKDANKWRMQSFNAKTMNCLGPIFPLVHMSYLPAQPSKPQQRPPQPPPRPPPRLPQPSKQKQPFMQRRNSQPSRRLQPRPQLQPRQPRQPPRQPLRQLMVLPWLVQWSMPSWPKMEFAMMCQTSRNVIMMAEIVALMIRIARPQWACIIVRKSIFFGAKRAKRVLIH